MRANPPIAVLSSIDLNSITGKRVLIDVLNQLWLRSGGAVDLVEDLEATQTSENGGNRSFRRWEDEIYDLKAQIVESKRRNRQLEQAINEISERLNKTRSNSRLLEQKLNEIIERVDCGA